MVPATPNPETDHFDHRGPRLSFVATFLCMVIGVAAAEERVDPLPPHPARWRSLDGPRIPVAGAAGVVIEDRAAVLGGFTDRLEATAAVQIRDPRHGWMPVGTALLEPRAEASAIPLDDGTLLVIGGWSGHLPDATAASATAELCDPWNPHHRRPVPPPFADRIDRGLEGHAACRLADGRVLLVHEREGVVFDPSRDSWSNPFPLACTRLGSALVPLAVAKDGDIEILVIGGGRNIADPAIESIRIASDSRISTEPWKKGDLPADLTGTAAIRFATDEGNERILVAGGLHDGSTVTGTWVLDPSSRCLSPGPSLPIEGGVMGARLAAQGHRLVLLGGERRDAGRPLPVTNGVVLNGRLDRAWPLPPIPNPGVRATILEIPRNRSLEILGGYRFDRRAPRGARIQVLDLDVRLELPRLLVED